MTSEEHETTTGGSLGKVVGKVKEVAGEVAGNDDLAREGRLQQAQGDADIEARERAAAAEHKEIEAAVEAAKEENELERRRLRSEMSEAEREAAIEHDRLRTEHEIATRERMEADRVDAAKRVAQQATDAVEERAVDERRAEVAEAARLRQQARSAEAVADAVDPEVQ
jgi:uncharacterized protein YjbJ (UPF0337 family)